MAREQDSSGGRVRKNKFATSVLATAKRAVRMEERDTLSDDDDKADAEFHRDMDRKESHNRKPSTK